MNARRALSLLVAWLLLGATPPHAAGTPWSAAEIAALHARVDAAMAMPELRGAHVGFVAIDTVRGTPLYERDADDEFVPASNFKLLVGSVALQVLGPDFTLVTTVSADAPAEGGVVHGNLYLRGSGDALLRAADLQSAAEALARAGLRHIDGAIVTDATRFDDERYAPGWSIDDIPYQYAAPVSALELEDGAVHLFVSPAPAAGAAVALRVVPQSGAFTIANAAVTGARGSADTTDLVRPWNEPATIEVTGTYPAGAPESDDMTPSVPDPAAYAGDVFLRALQAAGTTVAGGVRAGVTPAAATLLWTHASAPLAEMLRDFWLPSDNLMGEVFLKTVAVARYGEPGTIEHGIAVEEQYLRDIGVDPATLAIADGSGLSIYDRITPRDLTTILQSDWNGPQRDVVLSALPVAAERGTLADSFAHTPLAGNLFAKTGTHRHTRPLSGFLQTPEHGPVTFSLMIQDWLGADGPAGRAVVEKARAAILEAFDVYRR